MPHPVTRLARRRLIAATTVAVALSTVSGAGAANRTYFGPDFGNWTLAGNWNPAAVPTIGDDVFLGSHSAGTTDLHVNMNGFNDYFARINSVTVNSSGISGAMIVNQASAASQLIAGTINIGTTVRSNTWNQSAGLTSIYELNMGSNAASTGNTYNLSGTGAFYSELCRIGYGGAGTFNQTGGEFRFVVGEVQLGVNGGGTGTLNLSGGSFSGAEVTIGKAGTGVFNQTGGAVSAYVRVGGSTGTGTYNHSGGSSTVGAAIGAGGVYNLTNTGSLDAYMDLLPGGLFNMQGGSLYEQSRITLSGGTFRMATSVTLQSLVGTSGVIESGNGNAILTAEDDGFDLNASYGGKLQNGMTGTLALVKGGSLKQTLSGISTYSGSTTLNAGQLIAGSNTAFSPNSAFLLNGGTLDANGFNVTLGSLGGSNGVLAVGAMSVTAGGSNAASSFGGTLTGTGALTKSGSGELTLSGGGAFNGTINVAGGTLRNGVADGIPKAAAINVTGFGAVLQVAANQQVAALSGASLVTLNILNNSQLTVGTNNLDTTYQGAFSGTGSLVKTGTGTLTVGFGAGDTLAGNGASGLGFVVNAGTLALNKADGTNAIGGAMTVSGGTSLHQRSHQIANSGTLHVTGGTFNLNGFNEGLAGLTGNGGTVALGGGTLTLAPTSNATVGTALSGLGSLVKNGPADLTLTNTGSYAGSFVANAGKLILSGQVNAIGLTANAGGTLRFNDTTLTLNAGQILSNGGNVEYGGSNITNGFLRGTGTHTTLPGTTSTFNAVTTYNSTILNQTGPTALNNFTNGGTINNAAAGLSFNGMQQATSGILNAHSTINAADFTSSGVINLNPGSSLLNAGSNLFLGGGSRTHVAAGATLLTAPGTTIELNGGLLVNNGSVVGITNVNYGSLAKGNGAYGIVNVTDGGTFSPGVNAAAYSLVDGASFSSGSTLAIEVGGAAQGTGYDSLVSADAVALAGTISLSAIGAHVPEYGVKLHVVTSSNGRTGTFEAVSGHALTPLKWLAVTYVADGVDVQAALPGDANLDGAVSFPDLVALAQQYNRTSGRTWVLGDFTGDGATNFADLVALAKNYNTASGSVVAGAAGMDAAFAADFALAQSLVPEPAALSLLLLATTARRRRAAGEQR